MCTHTRFEEDYQIFGCNGNFVSDLKHKPEEETEEKKKKKQRPTVKCNDIHFVCNALAEYRYLCSVNQQIVFVKCECDWRPQWFDGV